jgi:hypothetical protein
MFDDNIPISLNPMLFTANDPKTGRMLKIEVPPAHFWSFYRTMKAVGFETTLLVAFLGAQAALNRDITASEGLTLINALRDLDDISRLWETKEDGAFEITYQLLRARQINRRQAAELASDILGESVNTEAWRKRLNTWVEDSGRAKIELAHGRPRKRKTGR